MYEEYGHDESAGDTPEGTVFFVTAFSGHFEFVGDFLKRWLAKGTPESDAEEIIERVVLSLKIHDERLADDLRKWYASRRHGRPALQLVRLDEIPVQEIIVHALGQVITSAKAAIVDITPDLQRVGDDSFERWNPNVFYELGRVHQKMLPTFIICDQKYLPGVTKLGLPFDIQGDPINYYDFSLRGLTDLAKRFDEWYRSAPHVQTFHSSQEYIKTVIAIRDKLLRPGSEKYKSFMSMVNTAAKMILDHVERMESFIAYGTPLRLAPLTPKDYIDAVLADIMLSLVPGESYRTVTTLEMWRNLERIADGSKFLRACGEAAKRPNVQIKRVFLIPRISGLIIPLRAEDCAILRRHFEMMLDCSGYEVRVKPVDVAGEPETWFPNQEDHFGIIQQLRGKTVFIPRYTKEKILVSMTFRRGGDFERKFESHWADAITDLNEICKP